MKRNFSNIYINKKGYSILAGQLHDGGTKKMEIGLIIQDTNGELSEVISVKKSKLLGRNTFDFLLDYEGDFDDEDILNVSKKIQEHDENKTLPKINSDTKLSQKVVYAELCNYVHQHKGKNNISITNGYCNIPTKIFNNVVNELDMGYSGIEIKKILKVVLNVLRTNSNRPYDYAMTDEEEKQYRVISFEDILTTASQIYGGGTDAN